MLLNPFIRIFHCLELGDFELTKEQKVRASLGQSVRLACQVPVGYPPPVVTWQTEKNAQIHYLKETNRRATDINGSFIWMLTSFFYKYMKMDNSLRVDFLISQCIFVNKKCSLRLVWQNLSINASEIKQICNSSFILVFLREH